MSFNKSNVKLGKGKAVVDPKMLKLKKYLKVSPLPTPLPALPNPPAQASWITNLAAAEALPMYLNDQLGDCVIAAMGHMLQQWNFYAEHPWQPTDAQVLAEYEAIGGYVPGQPNTDNGCVITTALQYWQTTGFAGHEIVTSLSLDMNDIAAGDFDEVQLAISLFGNVMIGVQLPLSAENQTAWIVGDGGPNAGGNNAPGSWGGHCVPLVAGSPLTKTCVTWGSVLKMSNNFFMDYCDEAYAIVTTDWLESTQASPSQLDLQQLETDLNALGQEWPASLKK
jgi:hypothetical protein